ncbi:hypothetical protein B0H67DRAFT_558880 [Lasiosphaeris hirsuta]|uniref:Uncharacterized protein n=1 Tax=Lasiosphaeris hirsuta TaxID=260670 RepID=A0AA40B889_9PEZI|nr:hypothetical protein B0H67DRAFT_558880 [Lasiosphaeris hirsuta]
MRSKEEQLRRAKERDEDAKGRLSALDSKQNHKHSRQPSQIVRTGRTQTCAEDGRRMSHDLRGTVSRTRRL